MRTRVKFVLVVMLSQVLSYYLAGVVAQLLLGAGEFYPPSPHAIVYLKDPHVASLQLMILPAQLLRGLIFGIVLLPVYASVVNLGRFRGSLAVGALVLFMGYVAASGGLIEHLVYFRPEHYPIKFALLTLTEVVVQVLVLSSMCMILLKRQFEGSGS